MSEQWDILGDLIASRCTVAEIDFAIIEASARGQHIAADILDQARTIKIINQSVEKIKTSKQNINIERPIKFSEGEKMWLASTMRTFARDYHQHAQDPENNKWFNAEAAIEFNVNWLERVVFSGKPIDSPEFQGA